MHWLLLLVNGETAKKVGRGKSIRRMRFSAMTCLQMCRYTCNEVAIAENWVKCTNGQLAQMVTRK
jgi:hypothetical protein